MSKNEDVETFQKLFTKSYYKKLEEAKYEEPVSEAAEVIEEAEDDDILKLEIRASNGYKVLEADRITDREDMIEALKASDLEDETDLESNAVMEEIGEETSKPYELHVSDIGYVLHDRDNFPIVTHCAAPMLHSREHLPYSNMSSEPVPDEVRQAIHVLALMHNNADAGNQLRAKAFEKVYDKEVKPELGIRESHIVNAVWNNYYSENRIPEIGEFVDWCVMSVQDTDQVLQYHFKADDLVKNFREEISDEQKEEDADE